MKRKPIMEDPAVRAAIKELKRVALAVNGDDEVKSTLIMLDVKKGIEGNLAVFGDICPCPACLSRIRDQLFDVLMEAARDGVEQVASTGGRGVLHS